MRQGIRRMNAKIIYFIPFCFILWEKKVLDQFYLVGSCTKLYEIPNLLHFLKVWQNRGNRILFWQVELAKVIAASHGQCGEWHFRYQVVTSVLFIPGLLWPGSKTVSGSARSRLAISEPLQSKKNYVFLGTAELFQSQQCATGSKRTWYVTQQESIYDNRI